MENLVNSQHSLETILASLCVVITLHLVAKVGQLLWSIFKKKDETNDKAMIRVIETLGANTQALNHLAARTDSMEKVLKEVVKYKKDIRKLFTAIKVMAGDEWSEIRKSIIEDDFSS